MNPPLFHSRFALLLVLGLLVPEPVTSAETGSVCIAPLPEKVRDMDHDLPGGATQKREPAYRFTVTIDEREPVVIPIGGEPQLVPGLDPKAKHRIVIRDAGKKIESFTFTFAGRGSLNLCLQYGPWYQTWVLDPPLPGRTWCRCKSPAVGSPS